MDREGMVHDTGASDFERRIYSTIYNWEGRRREEVSYNIRLNNFNHKIYIALYSCNSIRIVLRIIFAFLTVFACEINSKDFRIKT